MGMLQYVASVWGSCRLCAKVRRLFKRFVKFAKLLWGLVCRIHVEFMSNMYQEKLVV